MSKYKKGREKYFDKLKRFAARYVRDVGKFFKINSKEAKTKARPETDRTFKTLKRINPEGVEEFIKVQKPRKKGKPRKKRPKKESYRT